MKQYLEKVWAHKKLFFILSVFIVNSTSAQENCKCDVALSKLITKIESDYPGFEEKTKDKIIYSSFKKQLTEEAKATESSSCLEILKRYTSFFRDGHIWIHPATSLNGKRTASTEFIEVDIDKFLKK